MNYNLLEEKWIPVLYLDGTWERVGIRKALDDAGCIRQIAASNPMDNVALLRFLLALLYWCKGNPPAEFDPDPLGSFPADWFKKLNENEDSFNLLGEGKRFYQHRVDGDKLLTASYLIQEIPTGTNWRHFRHSTDEKDGLCPACCATGLLRLPPFATSGGRGKPPGINAKPPLYAMPVGESLAQTLRLSWQPRSNLGTPAWESRDPQLPKTGEVPILLGLTWLPRRVWLNEPDDPKANCISCGRSDRLIRMCVFAGVGSTKTEADTPGRAWRDPHVVCGQDDKKLYASDATAAADAAAGQWAKAMAGILGRREAADASSASIVGFATIKNDKYLEAVEWRAPLPCPPQHDEPSVARFEQWQTEGKNLARRLQHLERSRQHKEVPPLLSAAISAIRPHVEGQVSATVGELLAGGDEAWQRAAGAYRPMMEAIAESLSPGFTTAALSRRQQIAAVIPDMRPQAEPAKKSTRKNGGDK